MPRKPRIAAAALGTLGIETTPADLAAIEAAATSPGNQPAHCNPNTLLASSQEATTGIIQPEGNGVATGDFQNPAPGYPVTSVFGPRGDGHHGGIDLGIPVGTPINASDGGIVELTGHEKNYGNYIVINHGNGYSTLYAHLSEIQVKVGQKAEKEKPIGLSGDTGRSTGPHLHFEVIQTVNGVTPRRGGTIDPELLVNFY